MPRPNHDLPNLLLGGIKDYARREDVTQDEAHADLLARGLREVNIADCIERHAVAHVGDADRAVEDDLENKKNERGSDNQTDKK